MHAEKTRYAVGISSIQKEYRWRRGRVVAVMLKAVRLRSLGMCPSVVIYVIVLRMNVKFF